MNTPKDIYNTDSYSDKELFDILDLVNPSDRELEAKINSLIWKYTNIGGDSGDKLVNFYKDIYERFFDLNEVDTEEEDSDEVNPITPNTITRQSNVEEDAKDIDDAGDETKIEYNLPLDYAKGTINPLLQQTTKRIVSVDSQYRNDKSSMSSDFTFNLSDPLKDVVNIKLYSVQIPFTWYTISNNYGSNFFMINGNSPGITNGEHDYKVQIPVGNYTAPNLITAVDTALQNLKTDPNHGDTEFGVTSMVYDYPSSKTTMHIDIKKRFNESQYILEFQEWTTPNDLAQRTLSLPAFLGFNRPQYFMYRLYSALSVLPVTTSQAAANEANVSNFSLTNANNFFTIIHYVTKSTTETTQLEYITDASGNFTILDEIVISLTGLPTDTTYSRNALVSEVNAQLQNNAKLLTTSSLQRVDETDSNTLGFGNSHFELDVRLNRYTTNTQENSKVAVIFPENDTNIWQGTTSAFVFENSAYELSNIVSETKTVEKNFTILNNPEINLICSKTNFVTPLNDYSIVIPNSSASGYKLNEYLAAINQGITTTNNATIDESNPTGIFKMTNTVASIDIADSLFDLQIDLTKTFTERDYLGDFGTTVMDTILNISQNDIDFSGNSVINSTFPISGAGYTIYNTQNVIEIKPKPASGVQNVNTYVVAPPSQSQITYTNITDLEAALNNAFVSFQDEDGFQTLQGTNVSLVQVGNTVDVTLTINVRKYLTQNDFVLQFVDPSANVAWSLDDVGNSWANFLKIGSESFNLGEAAYNVANVSYAEVKGTEPVSGDQIQLSNLNNKIYLKPLSMENGGSGIYSAGDENTITIEVPVTNSTNNQYTRDQLLNKINQLMTSTLSSNGYALANGSVFSVVTKGNNEFTKIRLNINKCYKTNDYNVVFYDPLNFATFSVGSSAMTNTTWDATLGWILGYRITTEYDLEGFSSSYITTSTSIDATNISSITGDNVVSISIYNYFMIVLDDYNQNHLNDGVVTTTQKENTMTLPTYAARSATRADPVTGDPISSTIKKNGQNMTQNEIYASQQILNARNSSMQANSAINTSRSVQYYSNPFSKNVFALLPMKISGLQNNSIYVEFGGTLQNQQRNYFGPVNINRMTVKLVTDRGTLVDLNGANWSFSFICEQLYQQKKT